MSAALGPTYRPNVTLALRHPRGRGADAIVALVAEIVTDLRDAVPEAAPEAVGLVVPGIVDEKNGMAVHSANLGWRDLPLRDLVLTSLRDHLAARLTFEQVPDVLLASLGDEAGCLGAGLLAIDLLAGAPS